MNENHLILFGSFGFGNIGDELVPECFRRLLKAAGRDRHVEVISRFQGTQVGEAASFPAPTTEVSTTSGTVVLAGGGVIEPRSISCMNRAFRLRAQNPGLRVTTHAISVEPGVRFSWGQRCELERQLRHIQRPVVRDVLSAEILMRLTPKYPVRVVGDIALWMEPEPLPLQLEKILPKRCIAVILGDCWDTEDFLNWLASDLQHLANQMDAGILLIPFSGVFGTDFQINSRILDILRSKDPNLCVISLLDHLGFDCLTPGLAAELLSRCQLTISTRLHGCVVSYAVGTPFLALAYHPKLRGFVETVGHNYALVPDQLPDRQNPKAYGYAFADLGIHSGMLSRRAEVAFNEADFSATAYFRQLQVHAVREMLDRCHLS